MKIFDITLGGNSHHSTVVWQIKANSKEEALEKYKNGEGDIIFEEVEVMGFDEISKDDITEKTEWYEEPKPDKTLKELKAELREKYGEDLDCCIDLMLVNSYRLLKDILTAIKEVD